MSVQEATQSISTVPVIDSTIPEKKRQNRALESSIAHIATNQFSNDRDQNGLKSVALSLYAMDTTRRFHKVNKYVKRTDLSEERKYDVYTTMRLLDAFDGYENKTEIPQSSEDLVSLILLITEKIQGVISCDPFPELIELFRNENSIPITILKDRRLALLAVEQSFFKRVTKKFKQIVPIVSVYVAENPVTTPCRVTASIEAISSHDDINDVDRLRGEVDLFNRLQKQEQPRGIIETVGFEFMIFENGSFLSRVHYVQPRGIVLYECGRESIYDQMPKLLLDIAYGLQALHKENLVHFDIKSENIIVFNKTPIEARLIDLGLTVSHELKLSKRVPYGTWVYTPTDYLEKNYSLKHMDLFAFGLVMYNLFHNSFFPWAAKLRLGIQMLHEGAKNWESYIDEAKRIYESTLEKEEKLYLRGQFKDFHSLHRLSIDLLKQCTELTIDEVINRLETMQVTV